MVLILIILIHRVKIRKIKSISTTINLSTLIIISSIFFIVFLMGYAGIWFNLKNLIKMLKLMIRFRGDFEFRTNRISFIIIFFSWRLRKILLILGKLGLSNWDIIYVKVWLKVRRNSAKLAIFIL